MTKAGTGRAIRVVVVSGLVLWFAATVLVPAVLTNAGNVVYLRGVMHDGETEALPSPVAERTRRLYEAALSWNDAYAPGRRALNRLLARQRQWTDLQASYGRLRDDEVPPILAGIWRSLATNPAEDGDPRYDHMCTAVVRWLGPASGQRSATDLARLLRCQQWLGRDAEVAAGDWLDRFPDAPASDATMLRCLVAESWQRSRGAAQSEVGTLSCASPFDGRKEGRWSDAVTPALAYPVRQVDREGRFLVGVVVNPVDLDLGLPVATHFYWAAPPRAGEPWPATSQVHVTFARAINRVPNAGFAYERLLGAPTVGVLPIGYVRDLYGAPRSTRGLPANEGPDGGSALVLDNAAQPAGSSSGLTSYAFPVSAPDVYLQGAAVRNQGAGLFIGRSWVSVRGTHEYDYLPTAGLHGWERVAALTVPPPGTRTGEVWLINYEKPGTASFDQLFMLPLPPAAKPAGRALPRSRSNAPTAARRRGTETRGRRAGSPDMVNSRSSSPDHSQFTQLP